MELRASCIEEMRPIAMELCLRMKSQPIVLLEGPMGSGKTTLVSLIMEASGVKAEVSSPTYSIVQQYDFPSGKFFHFDLYRLKDQDELLDIGFEEYLDSGHPCLIEWPQLAEGLLPDNVLYVSLLVENETRIVHIAD
jgi:tRNA threonylcarbamoyladenosine biosynthesis protein TsaE